MRSAKTLRRHRGRAIRREQRHGLTTAQARRQLEIADAVWARLREIVRPAIDFVRVLMAKTALHPFPNRDGTGARRQLLHHGRAPRRSIPERRW